MSSTNELQSQAVFCKVCGGWVAVAAWPEMKGDKDWKKTIICAANEGHTVKVVIGRGFLDAPCKCANQEAKKELEQNQLSLFS